MTPTEKAKELVKKFFKEVDYNDYTSNDWGNDTAKLCSLICVDEIIKECKRLGTADYRIPFWEETKTEVEKL